MKQFTHKAGCPVLNMIHCAVIHQNGICPDRKCTCSVDTSMKQELIENLVIANSEAEFWRTQYLNAWIFDSSEFSLWKKYQAKAKSLQEMLNKYYD